MSQEEKSGGQFDPFGAWNAMRDTYFDTWSKTMIDLVNSKEYAEASARALDSYLTTSAPFRAALEKAMTQVLTQLNMPTRADVTSLAERMTNIEMRLDDLDAKLDGLQKSSAAPSGGKAAK